MAKQMKISAAICLVCTLVFTALYLFLRCSVLLSLAITAGTAAYHFCMRLAVGHAVNAVMHNRADYTRRRYRPLPFEARLYKALKVRHWKDRMPSYQPDLFSPRMHTLEEIIQAMCQAETVHEIIVPLSFLPLLAAIPFGALPVFIVTSLLACAYDSIFIIMQRYNRPRLVFLLQKQQKVLHKTR